MNRYEEERYVKELWNSVFFSSEETKGPIHTERTKKRRKKEYQRLIISLKLLKDLKEKESSNDEKTYSYVEPIYTDEDKEFLKQAVANGELSIYDLTFDEAIISGFTSANYGRANRKINSKINFSNKEKESEFFEKLCKMSSPTPRLKYSLYNHIQKKK